jgi:hypothetical protein
MKFKTDFITNSSSTAFIITNTSDKNLDLLDFVTENPQLIEEFKQQYDWHKDDPKCTQAKMLISATRNNEYFKAGKAKYIVFGDEQGTLVGEVFDYILRDGGSSENFTWRFCEYLR